jgi:hypothetical protein
MLHCCVQLSLALTSGQSRIVKSYFAFECETVIVAMLQAAYHQLALMLHKKNPYTGQILIAYRK